MNDFKATQLARALEIKIPFSKAYYIVYSDYPSCDSLSRLMNTISDKALLVRISKEITKLLKEDF